MEPRIARNVCRQRPQSAPAPHVSAISLVVDAPSAMTLVTTWLVIPLQRQTNIGRTVQSSIRMMFSNLPTNTGG